MELASTDPPVCSSNSSETNGDCEEKDEEEEKKMKVKFLQTILNYSGDVLTCCFSGRILAIGSADKLVRLFAIDADGSSFSELPQSPLCAHGYAVNYCQFTPLGTMLASCSQDGKAVIWDVRTGKKICHFEHPSKNSLRVCQFAPDARLFATGSDDELIGLWDVPNRKMLRLLEGHEASIVALAFTPDGSYVASGSTLGDLRFWDARFGHGRHLALVKEAHDLGVTCCQFSPSIGAQGPSAEASSGSCMYLLASGGNDDAVKIWRISIQTPGDAQLNISLYTILEGHSSNVMCLAFSSNGSLLASGAGDKIVIIWDPIKGEKLHQIEHHQRYVTCCAFSSDSTLLACGSNDKTVSIWKVDAASSIDINLIDFSLEEKKDQGSGGTKKHVEDDEEASCRRKSVMVNEGKAVSEWNVEDACVWLASLKCEQYADDFRKHHIDGEELLNLNESMLKSVLGVESLGHRNRILRALKLLHYRRGSYENFPRSNSIGVDPMPHEFYCAITHELMTDPVVAADGYTYERSAITAWVESGKRTSPMTNAPLPHLDLMPNRVLKMLIQKWAVQS